MSGDFDQEYWNRRWHPAGGAEPGTMAENPPHPYLARELGGRTPGTALDVGCGAGAEAIQLAATGWQVTGVDISAGALAHAATRARAARVSERVRWIEADATVWAPGDRFDLVLTCYAHATIPQLDFYGRVSGWVKPGGTLFIVGHRHDPDPSGHRDHPPADAVVTADAVTARLDNGAWQVSTAEEHTRTLTGPGGHRVPVRDVVVRATRNPGRAVVA